MGWLVFAILTMLTWGFYDVLYGKASEYFSPLVLILSIVLIQVPIFLISYLFLERNSLVFNTSKGWMIILMAVFLSAGNVFFYYAFKQRAPASVLVPMVTIGIAIVGFVWGVVINKEPLSLNLIIGLALGLTGIIV